MDFRTALSSAITDLTPRPWEHTTNDGGITLTPTTGGFTITVTEETSRTSTVTAGLTLPNQERLPLASALRRALDVARSWER